MTAAGQPPLPPRREDTVTKIVLLIAYASTVLVANWLVESFGLIPAGFGLLVPAGTYAAGLALGLRDMLQDAAGARWVLAGIAAGTALSAVVSPALALASSVAFLLSEGLDFAVYTPLRQRAKRTALIASNALGAVVDTLVFLSLAGFPLTGQSVGGQLLVKAVFCTAAVLVVREIRDRRTVRQAAMA